MIKPARKAAITENIRLDGLDLIGKIGSSRT